MGLTISKETNLSEHVELFEINNKIKLYARIISNQQQGKTAIFIHGGGSGGNHTMLIRPAKWLIEHGFFQK